MTPKKAESSIFSPIKIKLNGKEFEIPKVPYKTLKKLQSGQIDADAQLALLTGLKVEEIGEFDAREIAYALRKIVRELMNPFVIPDGSAQEKEEKNGSKPKEES